MSHNCKVLSLDFREMGENEIGQAVEFVAPDLAKDNEPAVTVNRHEMPDELGLDSER